MRDASNNLRPGKVPGTGVARRAPIEGNLRWRRDSELYMSDPRASSGGGTDRVGRFAARG